MISEYCGKRLAVVLAPREVDAIREYLLELMRNGLRPPKAGASYDWVTISLQTAIARDAIVTVKAKLVPILDAVSRSGKSQARKSKRRPPSRRETSRAVPPPNPGVPDPPLEVVNAEPLKKRRYRTKQVIEFPEPLWSEWQDPADFHDALTLHMRRHGDSIRHLHKAVVAGQGITDPTTLLSWCKGVKVPRSVASFEALGRIERRYRLPAGYFVERLPHKGRAAIGHDLDEFSPAERRRLAWHLPNDLTLARSTSRRKFCHGSVR
jgi:hypothetical protein